MPAFKTLWDNFPDMDDLKTKCQNKQASGSTPFGNYCAIALSECLIQSGVKLDKAPAGQKCWSHQGPKHLRLAEDLAHWLSTSKQDGIGKVESVDPGNFQAQLSGRTGIVFFKDYWRREGQTGTSGDHIDLWNKNRITAGSMTWRAVIEFFGLVSDLNKSKEVRFWEVK